MKVRYESIPKNFPREIALISPCPWKYQSSGGKEIEQVDEGDAANRFRVDEQGASRRGQGEYPEGQQKPGEQQAPGKRGVRASIRGDVAGSQQGKPAVGRDHRVGKRRQPDVDDSEAGSAQHPRQVGGGGKTGHARGNVAPEEVNGVAGVAGQLHGVPIKVSGEFEVERWMNGGMEGWMSGLMD